MTIATSDRDSDANKEIRLEWLRAEIEQMRVSFAL